ncbi:MAG TPA: sigma-70 family RNA polymerase sigma factor, partial [Conexibacter sp.]|nr:sigma-70 family RNA polymerase sigma factor [Conexibacter sp.]
MTAFAFGNRRAAADALLAREYDERKPEVVTTVAGKLAGAGIRLDPSDLDAAYNQAWHALHTKLADGEAIDNPTGLLVAITHRRALDEHRALHVNRRADADDLELIAHEHDIDQRLDDEMQLRQFLAGLRERLNRRELQAAALCYVYEYSRPEAARLVGVPPKRMEKIMDAVSRKLAPVLVEIRSGTWCEQHSS